MLRLAVVEASQRRLHTQACVPMAFAMPKPKPKKGKKKLRKPKLRVGGPTTRPPAAQQQQQPTTTPPPSTTTTTTATQSAQITQRPPMSHERQPRPVSDLMQQVRNSISADGASTHAQPLTQTPTTTTAAATTTVTAPRVSGSESVGESAAEYGVGDYDMSEECEDPAFELTRPDQRLHVRLLYNTQSQTVRIESVGGASANVIELDLMDTARVLADIEDDLPVTVPQAAGSTSNQIALTREEAVVARVFFTDALKRSLGFVDTA